jgi:hypothetical protein
MKRLLHQKLDGEIIPHQIKKGDASTYIHWGWVEAGSLERGKEPKVVASASSGLEATGGGARAPGAAGGNTDSAVTINHSEAKMYRGHDTLPFLKQPESLPTVPPGRSGFF